MSPLQFQTTHGRIASRFDGLFFALLVAIFTRQAVFGVTSTSLRLSITLSAFGILLLWAAFKLSRRSIEGLYIGADGRLTARGSWVSWTAEPAPARSLLRVTNTGGNERLELRLAPNSLSSRYVPSVKQMGGPFARLWARSGPDEVLVRDATRRRAPWQRTGVVWGEDTGAFLDALSAYVDEARGIEPQDQPNDPPVAHHHQFTPTLAARYRTEHSLITRRGRRLGSVAGWSCALGGAFIAFAAVPGYRWMAAFSLVGFGVALRYMQRATDPAVSLPGRGQLTRWGSVGPSVLRPVSLEIGEAGPSAVVRAVDQYGRIVGLPALRHHRALDQPNELLVRVPHADGPAVGKWHGTGVYWGETGEPVREFLEQALRSQPEDSSHEHATRGVA